MTSKEHTVPPAALSNAGHHTVRVSGDMDYKHAQQLHAMLMAAVTRAPAHCDVVVDLRNSSFCDSAGLSALLAARQQAREQGTRLVLAAPSHQMIRVLELTGSLELFTLCPTVTG
ncbi:STAS domain-containing protein [Streptomyces sp. NPDC004284]|uniref:STAS domain-containing protein n=1 Tax=Streptomyces sp. NPDC004284 TaxID=3364695 RepID=UPI0036CE819F